MQRSRVLLVVALLFPLVADGQAATPLVARETPAEPEALRLDTPKAAAPAAPARVPPPVGRVIRGNPLWGIPLRQLTATRERPLFVPSRRAPAPVVAAAAPPPPPPPEKAPESEPLQLALTGTVAGGDGAIGVFLDKASGTPLRLKVGEKHKGWTLRSVGRRDVVLAKGMSTTKLAMVTQEPAKPKVPEIPKAAPQVNAPPPQPAKTQAAETPGASRFDLGGFNVFLKGSR